MTERNILETAVMALYTARRDNDLDGLMSCLHPDCSFRIAGTERLAPMSHTVTGNDAMRTAMQEFMNNWDFTKLETSGIYIDGETVFAVRSGIVRFIPTDQSSRTEFVDHFTFRDGKVIELVEYIDTLHVAETVGLVTF